MAKVRKKIRPKISKRAIARDKGWMVCGFDLSLSSVAGAAYAYDRITDTFKGPVFVSWRWGKGTEYYDRITDCSRSFDWIEQLQTELGVLLELDDVFIAVEEPFPFGMVKQMESNALKQQSEISGAFLGGLLRYGYKNIFQISANQWRQIVAAELGITIHHTKYNYTSNPFQYAPSGKGSGKWRSKEYGLKFNLPDWPDMIDSSKHGKIPRPEESKAKAVQPDDRYDAYAIMEWMKSERARGA